MRDELLGYYERELIFLRRMGADFARRYPKIAARLQLDEEKIEDPHVERMVALPIAHRGQHKFPGCKQSAAGDVLIPGTHDYLVNAALGGLASPAEPARHSC